MWRFPPITTPNPHDNSPHTTVVPATDQAWTVAQNHSGAPWNSPSQKSTIEAKDAAFPGIPGFIIHAELGRGGMGIVYEATQINLGRRVALKVMLIESPDLVKRFQLEATALGRIQHEGILEIYDVGILDGRPFLVTELMKGGTLAKATAGLQVQSHEAALLVLQMANSLAATHAAGILHRDLKPGNVLLAKPPLPPDGNGNIRLSGVQVKLGDFGLAKDIEADSQHLTQTGVVMGTPGYMAPEQALGKQKNLGPATDTFALGAILYELLSGRPPFRGETPLETLRMTAERDPVALSKLRAGIPVDLETICLKSLQKNPTHRYTTATDLAHDLEAFLSNRPIKARRAGWMERSLKWCVRNPTAAASIGIIATSLMILLLLAYLTASARIQRDGHNLASLQKNLGFERLGDNDISRAAIWFAAALAQETRPENQAIDRLRMGALIDGFHWIRSYIVHDRTVRGAEWSPSGRLFLCYGDDRSIRIQDPTQFPPTLANTLLPQSDGDRGSRLLSVHFLEDSRVLALDKGGNLFDWLWKEGGEAKRIGNGFTALSVDATHTFIALARNDTVYMDRSGKKNLDEWATFKPIPTGVREINELLFMADSLGVVGRSSTQIVLIGPTGEARPMTGLDGPITTMAKDLSGKILAAGNEAGDIRIWKGGQAKPENLVLGHPEKILCLGFSHDGKFLASGSTDHRVSVHDIASGSLKYQISHDGEVTCLAFATHPDWLYTGSEDNTVKIWHKISGREASSDLVYNGTIRTIVPHPTAHLLLAGGDDTCCCLWDTTPKNRVQFSLDGPLDQMEGRAEDTYFALRQGETVLIGSKDPIAIAIAASTSLRRVFPFDPVEYTKSLKTLPVKAKQVTMLGGDRVLVLETNGAVSLWNMKDLMATCLLPAQEARALATAIVGDPSGAYFVLETETRNGKEIKLFSAEGGPIPLDEAQLIQSWTFGQDPGVLAWGDIHGYLWVAHIHEGKAKILGPVKAHNGGVGAIALSRGRVATGGEDMRVRVWNANQPDKPAFPDPVEPQHASKVTNLAFIKTGEQFLSGSEDNTLRLWDSNTGKPVSEPMQHKSSILRILPMPPGRSKWNIAATISGNASAYFWDLDLGQVVAPMVVPPGFILKGVVLRESIDGWPVLVMGGSHGTILIQKLVEAPDFATNYDLLTFAEYHPAFAINQDATELVPIPGSEILPRMTAFWAKFGPMFPPLPAPFHSPETPKENLP